MPELAEFAAAVGVAAVVLIAGAAPLAIWSWQKGRAYERSMKNIDAIQDERDEVTP
ncbi:hypothetical protein SEA_VALENTINIPUFF_11 [Microbacterium phage ValentiniPuff]|uniref:Uncharacterized protein n=1 Tax=Microbacterium phage ValentiniPuff TaxID=2315705 RepID=A0A386KNZ3_9CAUD|nr:hypothetical protein SEA_VALENTINIPUFF_11 [Microbacterium phage ValentiniPuff]